MATTAVECRFFVSSNARSPRSLLPTNQDAPPSASSPGVCKSLQMIIRRSRRPWQFSPTETKVTRLQGFVHSIDALDATTLKVDDGKHGAGRC
jgi:hypothetical protein